jgi:hypothetical protein
MYNETRRAQEATAQWQHLIPAPEGDFILGREFDRTSNSDSKVVPQSFKSGKTEYSNPKNKNGEYYD